MNYRENAVKICIKIETIIIIMYNIKINKIEVIYYNKDNKREKKEVKEP